VKALNHWTDEYESMTAATIPAPTPMDLRPACYAFTTLVCSSRCDMNSTDSFGCFSYSTCFVTFAWSSYFYATPDFTGFKEAWTFGPFLEVKASFCYFLSFFLSVLTWDSRSTIVLVRFWERLSFISTSFHWTGFLDFLVFYTLLDINFNII
jgi:hypothetical protein